MSHGTGSEPYTAPPKGEPDPMLVIADALLKVAELANGQRLRLIEMGWSVEGAEECVVALRKDAIAATFRGINR